MNLLRGITRVLAARRGRAQARCKHHSVLLLLLLFLLLASRLSSSSSNSKDVNESGGEDKRQERHAREAYATLITSKDYIQGAIVVARIVKSTDDHRPFLTLVLDELLVGNGGKAIRRVLESNRMEVIPVPRVKRPTGEGALAYPNYATTHSKLFLWNLTAYRLVLYLDADLLPLRALSPLFHREIDVIGAVPDISLPDHFNSALMLLRPNAPQLDQLLQLASSLEPYDGGDQGLLNEFFNNNSAWYQSGSPNRFGLEFNLPVVLSRLHRSSWLRTLPRVQVMHFSGGPDRRPWGISDAAGPVAAATLVWHAILCRRCFISAGTEDVGQGAAAKGCIRAEQIRNLIALPVNDAKAIRSMGPVSFEAKVKKILQNK